MLQPLAVLTALLILWFAAGLPLVLLHVRSRWDPTFRWSNAASWFLSAGWMLHGYFPVLAVSAAVGDIEGSGVSVTDTQAVPVMLFILVMALEAGRNNLVRRGRRLERQLAGDPDTAHVAASAEPLFVSSVASGICLVAAVALYASVLDFSPGAWVGCVLLGGSWALRPQWKRPDANEGALFPFPELPLEEEIRFLLARHHVFQPVYVQPPGAALDPFGLRTMVDIGRSWTHPRRRYAIPSVMLHALDPDVYTACLARDLAFSRVAGREESLALRRFATLGCFSVLFAGVVIIMAYVIALTWAGNGGPVHIVLGLTLFLAVGVLFFKHDMWNLYREQYREAYLNWHDADPEADRTVEEFVAAICEGEIVAQAIAHPEVALHRLRRERGLMAFLDLCGPDFRDAAFDAARERAERRLGRETAVPIPAATD